MKRILVINGSPRVNGNSETLAQYFLEGVKEKGYEAITISVGKGQVKSCMACNSCYQFGKPCPLDENFCNIAQLIEESDVIVFSTPLYWYNFPSQIKSVIDKFYSFVIGKKDVSNKESVLLVCGELKDQERYSPIVDTYQQIVNEIGWKDVGVVIATDVFEIGDISNHKSLEIAKQLGSKI